MHEAPILTLPAEEAAALQADRAISVYPPAFARSANGLDHGGVRQPELS